LLKRTINQCLVIPISRPSIHNRWAQLYSHSRAHGLPIQHDHNDVWIAATASVGGFQLLSSDGKAFLPLRGTPWVNVIVLDPKRGMIVP
jgi:predicted nucleic acid-binding protein